MAFFKNPRNLPESFGLLMLTLSLSGLFPYYFDAVRNTFRISRKFFTLTVLHFTMYTYINITSLLENWKDFAQPMIGHSSLTAFGNLVLRLLAMFTTFLILTPLMVGSRYFVSFLNIYVQIIEQYIQLGIDVKCIYRRIYILCFFVAFIIALSLIFTAWHSIYFYELITHRPPALKYYLMAFLANFYKILFMFYGNIQLFAIYLISKQLNQFVENLLPIYREDYERKRVKRDVLRKKELKRY